MTVKVVFTVCGTVGAVRSKRRLLEASYFVFLDLEKKMILMWQLLGR